MAGEVRGEAPNTLVGKAFLLKFRVLLAGRRVRFKPWPGLLVIRLR